MSGYRGTATLLFNSQEHSVHADLRHDSAGRLPSWRGTITTTPDLVWAVFNDGGNRRLRLPDGREGEFMPRRTSAESGTLEITGSGTAPF